MVAGSYRRCFLGDGSGGVRDDVDDESQVCAVPGHRRGCALVCASEQARPNLGRFLGAGMRKPWQVPWRRHGQTLADSLGTSKVAPWHEQGRALARAMPSLSKFLGHEQGRFLGHERGVFSPRGGMGKEARRTLEHALGTMPREDPRTHGPATPSRLDSTEPPLAPEVPGRSQAPPSSPRPLEKHGPRPLRHVQECPEYMEHVLIDQAVEAVMEPSGRKGARQLGNISSSTDQKLDRMIPMMEHLLSSGEVQVNPTMDSSYSHNYGRYENSHYNNVNGVDYSHSVHNCPYHPQYKNYHYSNYASPQPYFSGFMSHLQAPQHEGNHQFHQSLSLEDMVMQMIYQMRESAQDLRRASHNIRQLDFSCPGSKDLVTDLDQYSATLHRTIDEAESCSTQPTFNPDEDVGVHTLTNLEVHEDIQMEDYLIETSDECEVFQIEPEIVIALNEGEDEMKIDVNSDKLEMPQIESEEDQLLVLIFYTADTFVLDEPDMIDSFVLEVLDELLNLKEGMHASLPKHVDAPFAVDISKGEGIM
ncbi:hypothetical protein Syun_018744 [Stephania yunnanensis]|uniref:Uncharacterized protein n=1 Tax=Stephania yunnanensis TaxID=152371 RepID=A0AAP0IUQ8_9MAGN